MNEKNLECKKCGANLPVDAVYCIHCGIRLSEVEDIEITLLPKEKESCRIVKMNQQTYGPKEEWWEARIGDELILWADKLIFPSLSHIRLHAELLSIVESLQDEVNLMNQDLVNGFIRDGWHTIETDGKGSVVLLQRELI